MYPSAQVRTKKTKPKQTTKAYYLFIQMLNHFCWWEEQKHEIRFQISIQIVDFIPILWNDP